MYRPCLLYNLSISHSRVNGKQSAAKRANTAAVTSRPAAVAASEIIPPTYSATARTATAMVPTKTAAVAAVGVTDVAIKTGKAARGNREDSKTPASARLVVEEEAAEGEMEIAVERGEVLEVEAEAGITGDNYHQG